MVMEIIISVVLLFVGIALLAVIHLCVVGRVSRGDPGGGTNSTPARLDQAPSMILEDIRKLPCFDYRVGEKGNENILECAVCLEVFMDGEKCRILPKCNHCFHAHCIDSWLLENAACPICRTGAELSRFGENSSSYDSGEVRAEFL